MEEIESITILTATPGVGSVTGKKLIERFGTASAVLGVGIDAIKSNVRPATVNAWKWWEKNFSWKQNLELAQKLNVKLIPYTSPDYPQNLLEIHDHPLLLYVKGNLTFEDNQSLAVVGTRNCSFYGKEMATMLSEQLARIGFTIVSGLARGIDASAHVGALRSGRTLAVIGSGLANIYPKENVTLSESIAKNGAVISEFSMLVPPERKNFPRRNRIVSGMTLGTLLIEAGEKSGAMITMDQARQQGRKLFALPGRADQNFKGNHYWIKTGLASLVENAQDIVNSFENLLTKSDLENVKHTSQTPTLDAEERELLQKIPQEELNIEEIIKITKLPVMKLNILLMSLVMKKLIKEYPGKIYIKDLGR